MHQLAAPTRRELSVEVSQVLSDLPALVTAPLYRRWHRHWGATNEEPSASTIVAELQHLEIGQWVPMSPSATPSERTALKVAAFELYEWLLWTKPDSTWVWQLKPSGEHGTRLVTRIHAVYDWKHPLTALLGVVLMEFGDFAMQRRMLRGIKAGAESMAAVGP
jgi:hypothetical protein